MINPDGKEMSQVRPRELQQEVSIKIGMESFQKRIQMVIRLRIRNGM